jgi:hypothetical protein
MPKLQRELLQYGHNSEKGRRNRYFLQTRNIQAGPPPLPPNTCIFYALRGKLLKTYETGKNHALLQALHGTASAETDRFLYF